MVMAMGTAMETETEHRVTVMATEILPTACRR